MGFDKLAAVYVWCADNHGGQGSREYRIMSRISARGISLSDRAWDGIRDGGNPDWEEAHEIYTTLDG